MSNPDEVLFTITRAHLNTGLRGFPVGTCRTSAVHPIQGVSYVGWTMPEIAFHDPEAVIHLVLERRLPTPAELVAYKAQLRSRGAMPAEVIRLLKALPREGHPMEWLIAGLNALGMVAKTGDYREDARNLIAWAPELVAAIFRIRSGWGDPIPADTSLGLMEDFARMLGVPGADVARLTQVLRVFYVLHMDHGGGNLSTFVGKAIASSHTDMYASMGGAMAALYGPLHGKANQDCLEFVQRVGSADPVEVERFVRDALDKGDVIYGFGHAVLRAEDPRAAIQYELGEQLCPNDPLFRTAVTLREVGTRVLSSMPKVSNPYPNVDAVSGTLLHASGLTDSDYYTVLFGLSRMTGIAAQIVDERLNFRGGKGAPIVRPKYIAEDQEKRS